MNIRKVLMTGILALLLVGALALAFLAGSVAAQTPTPKIGVPNATPQPQKNPQAQEARVNARLEKAFRALEKLVGKQERNIERANAFVKQVETLIGKAKANGKETSALDAAVAAFKTKQAEALKLNSAAADIIKTHAGFDANGKVVNPELARQTLKSGHEQLKETRGVFGDALKKLHEALKAWRTANPPPAPTSK